MLHEYYRRRLYGGRSALARGIDFIALRAVLFAALYLWFSSYFPDPSLRFFLSFTLLLLFCVGAELFKSIRLDSFKARENRRLREAYVRARILLLPGRRFTAMVRAYTQARRDVYGEGCLVLPVQQSEPLGRDALLRIYRLATKQGYKKVALFSLAPVAQEAEEYLVQEDLHIVPQSGAVFETMAEEAGMGLTQEALEAYLLSRLEGEKQRRKKNAGPFMAVRVRRYLSVALVLFAASFFVEQTLYYRLMAGLCFSFASLAWWMERGRAGAQGEQRGLPQ